MTDERDDALYKRIERSSQGRLLAELARLRREKAELVEALEWYAKAVVATMHPASPGHCDDGGHARRTLAAVRSATEKDTPT